VPSPTGCRDGDVVAPRRRNRRSVGFDSLRPGPFGKSSSRRRQPGDHRVVHGGRDAVLNRLRLMTDSVATREPASAAPSTARTCAARRLSNSSSRTIFSGIVFRGGRRRFFRSRCSVRCTQGQGHEGAHSAASLTKERRCRLTVFTRAECRLRVTKLRHRRDEHVKTVTAAS